MSMTPKLSYVKLNSLKVSEPCIDGTECFYDNHLPFTAMFLSKSLISSPFQIDAVLLLYHSFSKSGIWKWKYEKES